jgi:hypothetical protein
MLISGFENDTFNQAKLDEILIDIRRIHHITSKGIM